MLLNQSYKLEATDRLQWISIVSAPHMKKEDAQALRDGYINASRDIIDTLAPDDDFSSLERLRNNL